MGPWDYPTFLPSHIPTFPPSHLPTFLLLGWVPQPGQGARRAGHRAAGRVQVIFRIIPTIDRRPRWIKLPRVMS